MKNNEIPIKNELAVKEMERLKEEGVFTEEEVRGWMTFCGLPTIWLTKLLRKHNLLEEDD